MARKLKDLGVDEKAKELDVLMDQGIPIIVNGEAVNFPATKTCIRVLAGAPPTEGVWVIGPDGKTMTAVEDGAPTPTPGTQYFTMAPLPANPTPAPAPAPAPAPEPTPAPTPTPTV